jgi:methionyl-tRNA synthetase
MPLGVAAPGDALFPRVDLSAPAPAEASTTPLAAPAIPEISIEEFRKLDLRVATILAAEAVPKSKKLVKLRVSTGMEERTVVAGILEQYAPADLVGKQIVIVANLKPSKLMGVESRGMILAATGADGTLALVAPERAVAPGAQVK